MYKKNSRPIIDTSRDDFEAALSRAYMFTVPTFHREETFELLKQTIQVLDAHHIEYWADGGTLLGAVRHGGMLVFDDNANISVEYEDWDNLLDCEFELKKLATDFEINEKERIVRLTFKDKALRMDEKYSFRVTHGPPTVKIVCYRKEGRRLRPARPANKYVPVYNKSWIYPLQKTSLFNYGGDKQETIEINVPANPKLVLTVKFPCWEKYWTLNPRCGWSYYLQKTIGPYFPLHYYPNIYDEVFQECFKKAVSCEKNDAEKEAEKNKAEEQSYFI